MTQTFQGLRDIDDLPAPSGNDLVASAGIALGICLLLVIAFKIYRRQTSRQKRALRALARMRRAVKGNEISPQQLRIQGYTVARVLSHAIGSNGVTRSTALPRVLQVYDDRWTAFRDELATVRYAKNTVRQADDIEWLIDEASFWLSKWP